MSTTPNPSKIEWTEATWNPLTGCSHAGSPGCDHCYARRMANRLRGRCGYPADDPFRPTWHANRLLAPVNRNTPTRIFVCSMGDLFHPAIDQEHLAKVFQVMSMCPQHTFMLLSKRAERMRELLRDPDDFPWPLPNVWLGVTAENQHTADERIPILLDTPAAKRFVSVEPMLGHVDLGRYLAWTGKHSLLPSPLSNALAALPDVAGIDWVIAGGESGPGARPVHPYWVRSLRDQCVSSGVPFFFKSWGEWLPGTQFTPELREADCGPCSTFYVRDYNEENKEWEDVFGHDEWGASENLVYRVGKRKAGHLLDGIEWRQFPEPVKER